MPVPDGDHKWRRLAVLTDQWLISRKTDNTRKAYRNHLRRWLVWVRFRDLDPTNVWPADVLEWVASLEADGEAGTTRAARLGAVSSWYRWLIRHKAASRNPCHGIEGAERPVRAPRKAAALSDRQAEAFLVAADGDSPRSAAMVWLMLTMGLRAGELVAANLGDLAQDRGVTVLHIRGKGGQGGVTRTVEVDPHAYARVARYLGSRDDVERRPAVVGQVRGDERPLFVTSTGRRVRYEQVRRDIRRLRRAAGLPADLRFTPHGTRATTITGLLDAGVPVNEVAAGVGHQLVQTTLGYDRRHLDRSRSISRAAARRFHADRIDAGRDGGGNV